MTTQDHTSLAPLIGAILEAMPSIAYTTEPNFPFALTFVSDSVTKLGLKASDLLNHKNIWKEFWLQSIHADDRPQFIQLLSSLQDVKTTTQVYRFTKPDGTICWIEELRKMIVDANGMPQAVLGFLTEREPPLPEHIPSRIAHEINNPLAIVLGKASILVKKLEAPELDREALQKGITSIQSSAERISQIIKENRLKK